MASSDAPPASNKMYAETYDLPDKVAKICRAKYCTSCKSVGHVTLQIYPLVSIMGWCGNGFKRDIKGRVLAPRESVPDFSI
jgi:hypothetical protein